MGHTRSGKTHALNHSFALLFLNLRVACGLTCLQRVSHDHAGYVQIICVYYLQVYASRYELPQRNWGLFLIV